VAPHDSRPLLFATLSTFETFTHTTLPVLPAHRNLMKITHGKIGTVRSGEVEFPLEKLRP